MFSNADLSEVGVFSLDHHGEGLPLSDNFSLWEFACSDGTDIVLIHPHLVFSLQHIRDHFGRPVTLNSAYRTPSYNKEIDGSTGSRHMYGLAGDIVVADTEPDEVWDFAANEMEMGGVGRYNTFTHVDVWGLFRRWDER